MAVAIPAKTINAALFQSVLLILTWANKCGEQGEWWAGLEVVHDSGCDLTAEHAGVHATKSHVRVMT